MPRSLATPSTSRVDSAEDFRLVYRRLEAPPEDPALALAAIVLRILQDAALAQPAAATAGDVMTAGLTPREREVFQLLRRGCTNRQIADQLVVGVRTVETHVEHILRKLNVSSRGQAVASIAL
jgi:DNA-binding NarL/FixJ family response regulator